MTRFRPFLITLILILAAGFAAACGSSGSDSSRDSRSAIYSTITVQEAYHQIKKNGSAVFIDVRESDEWAAGHPSGAILIPLSEFDQAAPAKLSDKNAEIYVICRSGNRSRIASQQLIDMGYTGVFNVDGGYEAWLAASLPTALD